jgi:hypothetical protein
LYYRQPGPFFFETGRRWEETYQEEERPVTGLYRKALGFHKIALQQDRTSDEAPANAEDGISAEERAKIAGRIEGILAENRIKISPQALAYTPKRRGALLPVISNIAILTVFALAGFVIFRLLNHQEQFIASGQAAVQGAENQLIAAMKEEADRQLRSRDQAILDAQAKLQSLSQEKAQLRTQTDSALKAKEQQLTAEFDRKLAEEKDRLDKQGLAADLQAQRLRDFEAARRQEIDRQLAAARRQAETDLAVRQKSITVLASQYQNDLDAARQQREQVQNDFTQRQQDVRAQAQTQQAAPQTAPGAEEDLARLRAQREKEQLILDQLLGGYSRVNAALQRKDYAEAQNGLDSLRKFLQDPSIASLPTILKRSSVEMFLIDSLSDLIASRKNAASADAAFAAEAAAQLRSVSDLVARGDGLSKAGDPAGARDSYLQAMRVIAPVNRGYQGLEDIRAADERRGSQDAIAGLGQANLFFQAGNFLGSLSQYRQAVGLLLKNEALANQLTDNVMNAGYRVLAADDLTALARLRTDEQKKGAILRRLQEIRSQYLAYSALPPQSSAGKTAGDQSLASLLQAKVLLRQILDSDPVRSQYPHLGSDIESYFVALEEQGRADGRMSAIQEMASVLDRLTGGSSPPQAASTAMGSSKVDPLVSLLDRLEQLLAGK